MKSSKNSKQMLFEMMGKLDSTFKPKLNETWTDGTNYSPDENNLGSFEHIFSKLENVKGIGVKSPNDKMEYSKLIAKNVSFKDKDNENIYFYSVDNGMGRDEEGQMSTTEPKNSILIVPIDAVIGFSEPSVLVISSDKENSLRIN